MSVVADTHALHWFLTGAAQLSARAREALEAAEADLASGIYVSVASRLDLHYLVAARRMDRAVASRLWSVVHDPDLNIHPLPITAEIVELFGVEALAPLRDPWDRLIVATTWVLGIPLVSADRVISRVAGVDVVW